MASVSEKIALAEMERVNKQKRPKMYCIARYQNRLLGDSETGAYSGYALCFRRQDYESLMASMAVGGVDILWGSASFYRDNSGEDDCYLPERLEPDIPDALRCGPAPVRKK